MLPADTDTQGPAPRLKRRRYTPSSTVCVHCRQNKLGCDKSKPCRRCVRLGRADTCVSWRQEKIAKDACRDKQPAELCRPAATRPLGPRGDGLDASALTSLEGLCSVGSVAGEARPSEAALFVGTDVGPPIGAAASMPGLQEPYGLLPANIGRWNCATFPQIMMTSGSLGAGGHVASRIYSTYGPNSRGCASEMTPGSDSVFAPTHVFGQTWDALGDNEADDYSRDLNYLKSRPLPEDLIINIPVSMKASWNDGVY